MLWFDSSFERKRRKAPPAFNVCEPMLSEKSSEMSQRSVLLLL